ncbi:unannotated protein [freshwater metagenome]|uniref:Unannotated protein n=1 Tax=freshwater metagenome TaxID=449393 RepID=A0A6J7EG14_9ZZZZ|nr:hypothetical protein [Actinomycetota bacterium]
MHIIRPSRAIGLLALAALIACAALAMLTPPAQSATAKKIYACQKKKGGTLRIVTKSKKCRKTEKKISWNVAGPKGSTGTQGAAGPSAVRFSGTGGTGGVLSSNTIASFSLGGVDFEVRCANVLFANVVGLFAKSASAATSTASGIQQKDLADTTKVLPLFKVVSLLPGGPFVALDPAIPTESGPEVNAGLLTYIVDTGTKTVVVHAAMSVKTSCTVSGWASAA